MEMAPVESAKMEENTVAARSSSSTSPMKTREIQEMNDRNSFSLPKMEMTQVSSNSSCTPTTRTNGASPPAGGFTRVNDPPADQRAWTWVL